MAVYMGEHRGFTLVELLVVIAIIGMLMGLLLPAVQQARESARQLQCTNNLHQLGVALGNHAAVLEAFPSGGHSGYSYVGDADRTLVSQRSGWTYAILPYMEMQTMHDASIAERISTPIPLFYCPSRRPPKNFLSLTRKMEGRMPDGTSQSTTLAKYSPKQDYAANAGAHPNNVAYDQGWRDNATLAKNVDTYGPVIHEKSDVAHADITDGLTHTILVGEKHLNVSVYTGEQDRTDGGDDDTHFSGRNHDNVRIAGTRLLRDRQGYTNEHFFGATHAGGANMTFCDGHNAQISYSVTPEVFQDLCNRADGTPQASF
ncbi:MAG: DUF1559 domain-containing protein [Thermoguttaceae bacterium]|nr:DUF1559 domain-containing protein [Planctomycetaceae bacterium]MBQ4144287.1 DUF1559 domain-containing protein [Thermoguttaceae bacterium]